MQKSVLLLLIPVFFLLVPLPSGAEVYMNYLPNVLDVSEGDPLSIPIFLVGGALTGKPVEFFIWRQDIGSGNKAYLSQTGWKPFTDNASMEALASIDSMVEYANIPGVKLYDSTLGVPSFTLFLCLDAVRDNRLPQGASTDSASCGNLNIHIIPLSCVPSSLILSRESLTFTATPNEMRTTSVTVASNCGSPLTYDVQVLSGSTWLSTTSGGPGALTITATSGVLAAGTHQGQIKVTSPGLPDVTLPVTFTVSSPCVPSSVFVFPSCVAKSVNPGETLANEILSVWDSCGNNLTYTVSGVSAPFISTPTLGATGTGRLTVGFNTASLPAGTYNGSITLSATGLSPVMVSMTVTVASVSPAAGYIAPGGKVLAQYIDPGEVQYYYFNETSSLGTGNNFRLWVILEDASQQQGMYDVDMVVRYSGPSCNDAMKPTLSDHQAIKAGSIAFGQNGFYFALAEGAFETIQINNNPEGCYYIMLYNTSAAREMINLYYSDLDSMN